MTTWPSVAPQPDLPQLEAQVLDRWRALDVFARSVEQRADAPVWTFFEGPPTANGRPGTHHVEARTFKDIFPRYRTMKGFFVRRKGGWDCHGLPVELEVEKELGLNSKADIEAYGIEKFNARCRESVLRYVDVWERLTERIGFWIDTDDPYRTMDATYVDSLWWGLKELWDRDLIFEDHRVAPYCGRCGTALSDAEVAQGYQTVEDPSVFVRFPLLDGPLADEGAALLVWTTTPWTLPSNTACAVGADVRYQLVRVSATDAGGEDELLVLAADLVERVLGERGDQLYEVVREVAPDELVGAHYEAPFTIVAPEADQDWRYVVTADFVTTTDGSGIVHLAPAFGADDMAVGREHGLPVLNPVDREGKFTVGPWAGSFVKDADPDIIRELTAGGRLFQATRYSHTYPHCWRCKRPLIYYAKPSWYIRTTAVRDQLLANNAGIDWHPEHIRDGRFGNWLENNVDWALSRDRYWGTPLPFWRCEDGHVTVVGSRAELSTLSGEDHAELDPHRPYVDEVVLPCGQCGQTATRVPDVADAWFDSGAMPYAQWGYPHQGREEFARHYPADYICEAIDQTRGWFYTLLAESTLLFGDSSYRTCVCLGHIVDEDGRKMSKSLGNILDPWELIERNGADALRWLMLAEGNPWVSRRVGPQLLDEIVRRFLLTIWNTHVFFTTYAAIDGFDLATPAPAVAERPAADRWVLAELADVVTVVDTALERYDVSSATRRLERFVDDLSNWYVRRNRRRFWKAVADDPADKAAAYHTLHTCLRTLAQLLAPFTPFFAERLWQDLVVSQDGQAPPSVHLTDFPVAAGEWADESLRQAMGTARRVVELGRQARTTSAVKVRQPLARALVTVPEAERVGLATLVADIADELNVKQVELADGTGDLVERSLKPNFRALGPAFGKRSPAVGDALRKADPDTAAAVAAALADAGEAVLTVDGEPVTLSTGMVEVVETSRTGWAVASQGGTSFALDTALSRELEVEGAARELVRAVNDLRKGAGLALDDRIVLRLVVDPSALDAELAAGGLYDLVAREVLATTIERDAVPDDAAEVDLGPGTARVAMERVR
ncbi:isoleucine--tRNA ligase [Egicoccus halophilus]|uniref:Isoleucine--tRNA ligase n=1 Tax=Egicoccus halophilus TaxID=1670830 RepID=A0A8J3A8F5_9ACTN|nr:isoleucine--tRNA ligase [Egicoccus halophilus]GGI04351.1 isoleucine--tRNA ligase [Egicoccus halophilus]